MYKKIFFIKKKQNTNNKEIKLPVSKMQVILFHFTWKNAFNIKTI